MPAPPAPPQGQHAGPQQSEKFHRSPLREGRALIARIENPSAIFDQAAVPRVAAVLDALDLGGHGIRGLSWLPGRAAGRAAHYVLLDPAQLQTAA